MKALLYKDLVSAKSTYLLLSVIVFVIAGIAITQDEMIIIPFIFVFMPIITNAISFGHECQSEFPKFLFTTPVPRKVYVKSKYSFAILFAVIAFVSGLIVFYREYADIKFAFFIAAVSFAIPIIFTAIQIPFNLKFGEEKGRIIMVATYILLFAVMNILGDSFDGLANLIQKISQINTYLITGLICGISIIILIVSQNIGIVIMKRKEY